VNRQPARVADVLSLLLNPTAITGGFFLVLARRFEPGGPHRWLVGGTAVVFATLLPLGVLFVLRATGRLSDIEMRIRSERTGVYLWCSASYLAGLALLLAINAAWPLTALMALLLPGALALTLLNLRWKVSIHATTLAGLAVLALVLFGYGASPFALLVPLAWWARWAAGAHTSGELLAGTVLGAASAAVGIEAARALTGQ